MKLSQIKKNPTNPRVIKDEKFKKLIDSLRGFPEMLKLRPMVLNSEGMVLGGNMRLAALKELGYKEIPDEWVKWAEDLTDEQQREFIIKDNVGYGDWDFKDLTENWDVA